MDSISIQCFFTPKVKRVETKNKERPNNRTLLIHSYNMGRWTQSYNSPERTSSFDLHRPWVEVLDSVSQRWVWIWSGLVESVCSGDRDVREDVGVWCNDEERGMFCHTGIVHISSGCSAVICLAWRRREGVRHTDNERGMGYVESVGGEECVDMYTHLWVCGRRVSENASQYVKCKCEWARNRKMNN